MQWTDLPALPPRGGVADMFVKRFDPIEFKDGSSRLAGLLITPPGWMQTVWHALFSFLRLFRRLVRLPCTWALVMRYKEVAEVLSRSDDFAVPFGREIARLNDGHIPGTAFILGMDARAPHDRQVMLMTQVFQRSEFAQRVTLPIRAAVRAALDESQQRYRASLAQVASGHGKNLLKDGIELDVELVHAVIASAAMAVIEQYYGVPIQDRGTFTYATLCVSGHLFGRPPRPTPAYHPVSLAARHVRQQVNAALKMPDTPAAQAIPPTVAQRLINLTTRAEARAILMGMIIGFLPTSIMACGHMAEMLLRRPEMLQAAREAASLGDDDLLLHCLLEALRCMPHNPFIYRVATRDCEIGVRDRRPIRIAQGTTMAVCILSAMFDSRQVAHPFAFLPQRPASDSILFGHGLHFCGGVHIAQTHMLEIFRALLRQPAFARGAGSKARLKLINGFPDQLYIRIG